MILIFRIIVMLISLLDCEFILHAGENQYLESILLISQFIDTHPELGITTQV